MSGFEASARLVAPTVPQWAIHEAVRKMIEVNGVPASQSGVVLFAVGRLIGIPDDKLPEFCDSRARRAVGTLEEFLNSFETVGEQP
jgi:hypothetical protein